MPRRHRYARHGGTLPLVAVLMPVLIAMLAFSVDVGRMYLVRCQLQTAVDAGALAAGLQLREDPDNVAAAVAKGVEYVQRNQAGAFVTVPKDAITIQAGRWDPATRSFLAGATEPDAVQVSGNLDNEPLFFAQTLGMTSFAVPRSAIAVGGGSPLDVMMTLDLSGSMYSQGRIQALRNAAPTFVDVIEEIGDNDRIGVMGYGCLLSQYDPGERGHLGIPYTSAPASLYPSDDWAGVLEASLTHDFDYLRGCVLDSGTLLANKYNGWTPVGGALRDTAHYLAGAARPGVEKAIVLMSDGHANKPAGNGPGYALEMAAYALAQDITVYTISLGNGADEDMMQQIADLTGGEHFIANGSAGELSGKLTEAFEKVADAMKQTQLVQ